MSPRRLDSALRAVQRMKTTGLTGPDGGPVPLEQLAERLRQASGTFSGHSWRITRRGWTALKLTVAIPAISAVVAIVLMLTRKPPLPEGRPGQPLPNRGLQAPDNRPGGRAQPVIPDPAAPVAPQLTPGGGNGEMPGGPSVQPGVRQEGKTPGTPAPKPKQPEVRSSSKPAVPKKKPSRVSEPAATPARILPGKLINSLKMELTLIPSGDFLMGADPDDPNAVKGNSGEKPQHPVSISQPFYLGKWEVTKAEFKLVSGQDRGFFKASGLLPVETVSWFDAVDFCNRLSVMEGFAPYYLVGNTGQARSVSIPNPKGTGYRLPTEAEWEYACRANGPAPFAQTPFSFGANEGDLGAYAWFSGNSAKQTHEVSTRRANPFGLYDMHGNVWEWCWDWHDPGYYAHSPEVDPMGPLNGTDRIRRGGSWEREPVYCRSAFRAWFAPNDSYYDVGFRVARYP